MKNFSTCGFLLLLFVVFAVSHDALIGAVQGRSGGIERQRDGSGNGCDGPDSNLTQKVLAWKPQTAVRLGWKGAHVPSNSKVSFAISSYPSKDATFTLGLNDNVDYNVVNYTYTLPDGLNNSQLYVLRWEWEGWVSCQDFYVNPNYSTASSLTLSVAIISTLIFTILF